MALVALIPAALAIDEEGDVLRATLPLAGGTVLEHQVRLATAAGASPVVVLVERLPAALTAAIDRLRRDGLRVEVACTLDDAVDRIHPDETLLLMADGFVMGAGIVAQVADAHAPALLVVPDDSDHAHCERIDARHRWGGLLLTDGARLRRTVAMLGEWDLQSTLLRLTVQEDATRIAAGDAGNACVVLADDMRSLMSAERAMIDGDAPLAEDWPGRFLFPPVVGMIALPLLRRRIAPVWLRTGAVGAAMLAAPFTLFGWRWTALLLLLLSGIVAAAGRRLSEIRLDEGETRTWQWARLAAAMLVWLLLAADLAAGSGWGCWLLAAMLPGLMLACRGEWTIVVRLGQAELPSWLVSLDGVIWVMPPFALLTGWLSAMFAAVIYAAGSFAFLQHHALRISRDEKDEIADG